MARAEAGLDFTLSLAGGSTPRKTYETLASMDGSKMPWGSSHIYFGDERWVPHDDQDSNYRMARESLLDQVAVPSDQVHPVPVDGPSTQYDSNVYESVIRQTFLDLERDARISGAAQQPVYHNDRGTPTFDMILLGLGDDGHTASLFPRAYDLFEKDELVCTAFQGDQPRVTMALPLLRSARRAVFLVSGKGKSDIVRRVIEGDEPGTDLPARLVVPYDGSVTWLLDRDAASKLDSAS